MKCQGGGAVDLVIEKAAPRSNFSRLRDGAVPDGMRYFTEKPPIFGGRSGAFLHRDSYCTPYAKIAWIRGEAALMGRQQQAVKRTSPIFSLSMQ
jgi:hypothetical protein